jgi:hypothetical protein
MRPVSKGRGASCRELSKIPFGEYPSNLAVTDEASLDRDCGLVHPECDLLLDPHVMPPSRMELDEVRHEEQLAYDNSFRVPSIPSAVEEHLDEADERPDREHDADPEQRTGDDPDRDVGGGIDRMAKRDRESDNSQCRRRTGHQALNNDAHSAGCTSSRRREPLHCHVQQPQGKGDGRHGSDADGGARNRQRCSSHHDRHDNGRAETDHDGEGAGDISVHRGMSDVPTHVCDLLSDIGFEARFRRVVGPRKTPSGRLVEVDGSTSPRDARARQKPAEGRLVRGQDHGHEARRLRNPAPVHEPHGSAQNFYSSDRVDCGRPVSACPPDPIRFRPRHVASPDNLNVHFSSRVDASPSPCYGADPGPWSRIR